MKERLLNRLLSIPKDFTFDELRRLLGQLGYTEDCGGKTSGSRVRYYHKTRKNVICIHRPHPNKEVRQYVIRNVIDTLRENGDINE